MTFKEFIANEMTSTGDIAGFSRIAIPLITRTWASNAAFDMQPIEKEYKKKKKKKRYEQPQVKD